MTEKHVVWHHHPVTKKDRQNLHNHKSAILWFTGLSGAGKSTLAGAVERKLFEMGVHTYLLDGDNVRHGLNKDLGFTDKDRTENIRRIAEVAKLFVDAGAIVLTAFISPFRADRKLARDLVEQGEFLEIFTECPLNVCEERDPKGMYKKARQGIIKQFTGIDSPYEAPEAAELSVKTNELTIEQSVELVLQHLKQKGILKQGGIR